MAHQKLGNWESSGKSWLLLPSYDAWATTPLCIINWQKAEWFHQRALLRNVSCLSSSWLECTHFQNTLRSPFFLQHIFWRRETIWNKRVGRILLFFSAAVVCISGLVCLGVNYWWYSVTQNAVGLVKVGCTPVQWRLDRRGQPQETKNVSTSDQRSIPSNIF